jgi:capsular exopolysaccharide synthesis family protein
MEPLDFVRIFRQRWKIILASVLVAAGIAWVTTPAEAASSSPSAVSYAATATLIQEPGSRMTLPYIALLATKGPVPKAAAQALGYTGDPAALASTVSVTPDTSVGTLSVTVNDPDGPRAAKVANTYANTIVTTLDKDAQQQRQAQIDELTASLKDIQASLSTTQRQLKDKPGNLLLQAQQSAYTDQLKAATGQLVTLYTQAGQGSQLTMLQEATPLPVTTSGFTAPRSHRGRLLLGAVVGLLLGLLLALLIDRLDTRLRRREEVEEAFRLPVVAEVPHASRRERRRAPVAVLGDPVGRVAEAYRSLRTALTMWPSRTILIEAWGADPEPETVRSSKSPRVVLVTSARPGEGKTTTAANLAATLAETGKRVLVMDADFQNPSLHRIFDVSGGAGLANLLALESESDLGRLARLSTDSRIRVLTAGHAQDFRGGLPTRISAVVNEARTYADAVVIDAAPLLSSSDTLDFLPFVDSVVVVARVGRVHKQQAGRVSDLLGRTGAPVLGVVCIGRKRKYGDSYPRFGSKGSSGSRKRRGRAKAESEVPT